MINKKQKNDTIKFLISDCVIEKKVRQAFIEKYTKKKIKINQSFRLLFREIKEKKENST